MKGDGEREEELASMAMREDDQAEMKSRQVWRRGREEKTRIESESIAHFASQNPPKTTTYSHRNPFSHLPNYVLLPDISAADVRERAKAGSGGDDGRHASLEVNIQKVVHGGDGEESPDGEAEEEEWDRRCDERIMRKKGGRMRRRDLKKGRERSTFDRAGDQQHVHETKEPRLRRQ